MRHILEKYKGLSPAEAAEKIAAKYPKRDTNTIEANSFEYEMKELAKANQILKLREQGGQALKKLRNGGKLKYDGGNPLGDPTIGPIDPNNINPDPTNIYESLYPKLGDGDMTTTQKAYDSGLKDMIETRGNPQSIPSLGLKPLEYDNPPKPYPYDDKSKGSESYLDKINFALGKTHDKSSNVFDNIKGSLDKAGDNAYTPAYAGAAISSLTNLGLLAGGYDKVDPNTNPYENDIRRLTQGLGINMDSLKQGVAGSFNAARVGTGNARSANVQQAMNQNLAGLEADAMSKLGLQEQQANNQYRGIEAQSLDRLGMQKVQAFDRADELEARNKGAFQTNVSEFAKNLGDQGKFFTSSKLNERNNKLMSDILANKYSDFGLTPDLYNRIITGEGSDKDIATFKKATGLDNMSFEQFIESQKAEKKSE